MTNTNSPIDFFSSISDPSVERTQKHSLDSILFISLCAVICGAEGWNEIKGYGNAKRKQKDNAAQNFSLLNRIGLNIIKNAKVSSMGVKGHRKKAGWDNDYPMQGDKQNS